MKRFPPSLFPVQCFIKLLQKGKLTLLISVLWLITFNVSVYSQDARISLQYKEISLEELLEELQQQSDYTFLYRSDLFNGVILKDLNFENEGLTEVLKNIFIDNGYSYEIVDKTIIIRESKNPAKETKKQKNIVQGRVTDENNEPLPGVNILEVGTGNGSVTDMNGDYTISLDSPDGTLSFSYVGFLSQKIATAGSTICNVVLVEDIQALNEVVVVGYGAVQKRDITGSIASIKSDEITAVPTSNVLESMQGKIAGLDLVNSSGALGSPLNFTVRGNRSLMASNAPLILIDGIAYGSDLTINPNDVESIEVLKDASSTAIYGSRGANGVIMVTTKKGKEGKTQVNFNAYAGPINVTNLPNPNNTEEWVAFRREAMRAVNRWSSPEDDGVIWDAEELDRIENSVNTNWYDIIFDKAFTQNYQLSMNGGTAATKISASLNYMSETGVLKGEELNRYDGRLNIIQQISEGIKAGVSAMFNNSLTDLVSGNVFGLSQTQVPIGIPYNEDGSVRKYPFAGSGSTAINIMMNQDKDNYVNETRSNRFFGTAFLNAEIFKGLVFHSNFGYDTKNSRNGVFEGSNSTFSTGNSGLARVVKTEQYNYAFTWENTLTYSKDLGHHSFSLMGGQSMSKNSYESTFAEGKGLSFEESLYHNLDGTEQEFQIASYLEESSMLSFFSRLNYKLKDKYLFTATVRADGSSVLAKGHQWGYFPSLAVAWRIKNESFLIDVEKVSDLKLRVSYGVSGNSSVDPYQTTGGLSRTIYAWDETPAYGYRPYDLANHALEWEKTKVYNLGVDVGFFNNRLYAAIDAYQTYTSNLLLPMQLPGHTGFFEVISNVGKTETRGIDLSINSVNYNTSNFKWTSDLVFSYNKEKITALSIDQDDEGSGWFIGYPIHVIYDYEKLGIWQTEEAEEAAIYGQEPGDIKVRDVDNNDTINAIRDRMVLGQKTPKWTAGLNNRFEYKGWELSFFIYARIGHLIESSAAKNFHPSGWANSSTTDYWTPENPTNNYPRPNFNKDENMLYYTTLGYRKGDFVKIKNITFGYNFPASMLSKIHLSKLRIYMTMKNYFTFSEFDDYDPERGGANSYPMTKQIVFGLNVSF